MMCIQTPGSFVWAASLAKRLGREGWSAWGLYIVTGCLQGVLLGMGVSFLVRDWRAGRKAREGEEAEEGEGGEYTNGSVNGNGNGVEPTERSPLLAVSG
jgi:hypothetical protein